MQAILSVYFLYPLTIKGIDDEFNILPPQNVKVTDAMLVNVTHRKSQHSEMQL